MEREDTFEARSLVREYSWEVAERLPPTNDAYALGQLINHEATRGNNRASPWRKFFEPDDSSGGHETPVTQVIAVEAQKLRDKWLEFVRNTDKADELDLNTYEPTIQGALDMVKDVKASWDTKRKRGIAGKCLSMFHKSCDTLHAHRSFLEIIPEGSEYVSILAGTLTTVMKASVNHEKVAQGLSEALTKIDAAVLACSIDLEIFKSKPIVEAVSELYGHVFLFLSSFMSWFMKKRRFRLLDSFNENLFEKFETEISAIEAQSLVIQRLAQQSHHAEGRETRLGVEHLQSGMSTLASGLAGVQDGSASLARDVRLGLAGQARLEAEVAYYASLNERLLQQARREWKELRWENGRQLRQLSEQLNEALREVALNSIKEQRSLDSFAIMPPSADVETKKMTSRALSPAGQPIATDSADEMAIASAHLEDFFHRDRVRLDIDAPESFASSSSVNVLTRIKDWATTTDATTDKQHHAFLWISGAPTLAEDIHNPLSVLSAQFIDLVAESEIPVLSYFCEIRHGEKLRKGNASPEVQGVLALVYALIRQTVELLLPIHDDRNGEFPAERFQALDGTDRSWEKATSLLADLVAALPARVFCVIDGLHWLDDESAEEMLRGVLGLLRNEKLRVLLTTTGRSAVLTDEVEPDETMVVDDLEV